MFDTDPDGEGEHSSSESYEENKQAISPKNKELRGPSNIAIESIYLITIGMFFGVLFWCQSSEVFEAAISHNSSEYPSSIPSISSLMC